MIYPFSHHLTCVNVFIKVDSFYYQYLLKPSNSFIIPAEYKKYDN